MEDLNEKKIFPLTLYCQFGPKELASDNLFHFIKMEERKICFAQWERKDIISQR